MESKNNPLIKFSIIFLLALLLSSCVTNDTKTSNTVAAALNVRMGIDYLQKNNLLMAKKHFQLAIQEAPKNPSSWYGMAYFYEVLGQEVLADVCYRKAIRVMPASGEAHNNYGAFLCRNGKYHAAITEFQIAITDPNYLYANGARENARLCALKMRS